jgi:hypothetical protein
MTLAPLRQTVEQQGTIEHLSQLDQDMKTVLASNVADDVKLKLYMNVLRSYNAIVDAPLDIPAPTVMVKAEPSPQPPTDPLPTERLLKNIPNGKKTPAHTLIRRLRDRHVAIGMNDEVVINGDNIPGTNLVKLFEYCIRDVKRNEPIGYQQFVHTVGSDVVVNRTLKRNSVTPSRWYSLY